MSTYDVPGANPVNADTIGPKQWAEHPDGSLLYIKGTEGGDVVYEVYDPRGGEYTVRYPHVMPVKEFMQQYSIPPHGISKEKWIWHDKPTSAFPWYRVLGRSSQDPHERQVVTRDHPPDMTAASRLREALQLRAERVTHEAVQHRTAEPARRGLAVMDKIKRAMSKLKV